MTSLPDDIAAFLESMVVPGVLSTLRPDGAPITSAVWFALHEGRVIISTPGARNKARNARADARVSFLVDTKERPYRGVAIEGTAEVVDDDDGLLLQRIARRYLGEEGANWAAMRAASDPRVILRIEPVRVRPWNMAPTS